MLSNANLKFPSRWEYSATDAYYKTLEQLTNWRRRANLEDLWYLTSVQSFSRVQIFLTPWPSPHQASLSITNSQSPPKSMSIESVMPSNYLILCHPLVLLPSIFPSIRVFSNESGLHIRWPKNWIFSFNISPINEHPGLISFRMNWLNLFAVKWTCKSPLQDHRSKASILWCSAFFIVRLSHPYVTTGKTIALTKWTFLDKVMSLLFNMLSMLVMTFLSRSKRLLISWLQSPPAVILEPRSQALFSLFPHLFAMILLLNYMVFLYVYFGYWPLIR